MNLCLKNVSRVYKLKSGNSFSALKNINLIFSNNGLVGVVGKSGSGKSTLINLLCRIDTPTSGEISFNGQSYSSYKMKRSYRFFNEDVGIIFQQYNLLDDETVLHNACLPLYLSGCSKKKAKGRAIELLKQVGLDERLLNKKVSVLSGGEKQRVALIRAIINDPKVLLCDEPTGALDSTNSIALMEILKKISKTRLVIVVSHNLQLVEKYSDRIIELSDGMVVNDLIKHQCNSIIDSPKRKQRRNNWWINRFAFTNYKKRFKRNFLSSLAFAFSLTMIYLVVGFINGKDDSVKNACYRQFDFGSGTISEEVKVNTDGLLSISRFSRPDFHYLTKKTKLTDKFEICLNFGAIFPSNIQFSYQSLLFDDLLFSPIYSFKSPYIDLKMIESGSVPNGDSLTEVIINQKAFELISNKIGKSPLYESFNLYHSIESNYVNEEGEYISDLFHIETPVRVTGVCKEINYLATPKIYYSYCALQEYVSDSVMNNLSTYLSEQITWYDRIYNIDGSSPLSSYSYLLFLKDFRFGEVVFNNTFFPDDLTFTSASYMVAKSLLDFLEVAEYALLLFLGITFVGSVIILSIMSFASYSEDHKVSAILSSLGARNDEVQQIYLNESLLNGILSFLISTAVVIPMTIGLNSLIFSYVEVKNIIKIPFLSFLGIKFLLPLGMVILILLVTILSTILPIAFSKKRSLKDELQTI